MSAHEVLRTPNGDISFAGVVRHTQEYGAAVFWIDLPSRPRLYGEFDAAWARNGYDYDVEIVSFGYPEAKTVSNGVFVMFEAEEENNIKSLIELLFHSDRRRQNEFPFSSKKSNFLGNIIYKSGWIVIESEYQERISGGRANDHAN